MNAKTEHVADNDGHRYIYDLSSFRVLILRVIESFVHKSLAETVNLERMTDVINTNPLIGLVRKHMDETTHDIDVFKEVTKREVILALSQMIGHHDIHIMGQDDPNFKIMLNRQDFKDLIASVYKSYCDVMLQEIRDDEEQFKKKLLEIALIEKGEMDNVIIGEYNKSSEVPEPGKSEATKTEAPSSYSSTVAAEKSQAIDSSSSRVHPENTQATGESSSGNQVSLPSTSQSVDKKDEEKASGPTSKNDANAPVADEDTKTDEEDAEMVDAQEEVIADSAVSPTKAEVDKEETIELEDPQSAIAEKSTTQKGAKRTTVKANGTIKDDVKSESVAPETPAAKNEEDDNDDSDSDDDEDDDDDETESESSDAKQTKDEGDSFEDKRPDSRKRTHREVDSLTSSPAKKKKSKQSPVKPQPTIPNKKLQRIANPLIDQIISYKYASTFLQPVSEASAPDYYNLIKEPRDLKTIKQMVKDGRIQNSDELEREILLMFANAVMYNRSDTDIYNWTREMQVAADEMIRFFKDAEKNNN